jgi:hypothetical protein
LYEVGIHETIEFNKGNKDWDRANEIKAVKH